MSDFYARLQGTASALLTKFNQVSIKHWRDGVNTGTPFNPVVGEPTMVDLKAVAKGVEAQYIQESYITSSDIQITAAVFEKTPTTADKIDINGNLHEIIRVDRIPASGTVIAWRIFCRR
jgi:hypothetical protein